MKQKTVPGHCHLLGATLGAGRCNISLYSKSATRVELLLFEGVDSARPSRVVGPEYRAESRSVVVLYAPAEEKP